MAEAAIFLTLKKISVALGQEVLNSTTSLLASEVSLQAELPSSMSRIQCELLVMQSFLSHERDRNHQVLQVWLGQVRKLASYIEDILDEYLYLVAWQQGSESDGYVEKMRKRPRTLAAFHGIADKLKDVEANLMHLSQMKDRWIHMAPNERLGNTCNCTSSENHSAISAHFIDEEELVGIDKDKRVLTQLLESKESALVVLSLWGMGGLGKTTLITNIYKRERQHFDCHAWISVSQSYNIDDILRKLIIRLYGKRRVPVGTQSMDTRNLKEKLRGFLGEKRYLIVLDDVWSPTVFYNLTDTFVDNDKRSRIVITTRIQDVASLAHDGCKLELKPLAEDDAWDLFRRRAFRKNRKGQNICPPELEKCGKKIVTKCQGLPLAIVSIGSLLSLRQQRELEWRRLYDQLNWELEHNPNLDHVKNILNLSYNDLPTYLKNCFLYCSMFPEDYVLKRKRLIRLWIAEGFVEERGAKTTLEEVAEDYLNELIHRSLLQFEESNSFGRIKGCSIHDLVRELALSLSRKENFLVVYNNHEAPVTGDARRLSILNCSTTNKLSNIDLPRLRTLIAFDTTMLSSWILPSMSSKSRYITVLDLYGLSITIVPDAIGDLFNLRCLHLRDSKVKSLPKSICKLSNLQTLDLHRTEMTKLPLGIVKLNKLRHLHASKVIDGTARIFKCFTAVQAPEGFWSLKELQTVKSVQANEDLVRRLKDMTQLRTFSIYNLKGIHCEQLCSSISKMHFISRLTFHADNENEVLQLEGLNPQSLHLYRLTLRGRLSKGTLNSPLFCGDQQNNNHHLRELSLVWCQLEEDPIPSLSRLSNLTRLFLRNMYKGKQLLFRVGWFPNLGFLAIKDLPHVNHVEIENGAMVKLRTLELDNFKELRDVPLGIQFLTSLHHLSFREPHPELRVKLLELDEKCKFQHFDKIHIW
ncbi:disease resistance protein RPM1-like [Typha angustifolia]|uniref:disease resistance protein RPM1-like n=1 Tax=Typha angustifolia TaxID=59011 RepID=UPI003C2AE395